MGRGCEELFYYCRRADLRVSLRLVEWIATERN